MPVGVISNLKLEKVDAARLLGITDTPTRAGAAPETACRREMDSRGRVVFTGRVLAHLRKIQSSAPKHDACSCLIAGYQTPSLAACQKHFPPSKNS